MHYLWLVHTSEAVSERMLWLWPDVEISVVRKTSTNVIIKFETHLSCRVGGLHDKYNLSHKITTGAAKSTKRAMGGIARELRSTESQAPEPRWRRSCGNSITLSENMQAFVLRAAGFHGVASLQTSTVSTLGGRVGIVTKVQKQWASIFKLWDAERSQVTKKMTEVPVDPGTGPAGPISGRQWPTLKGREEELMAAKCLPSHLSLGEDFDLARGTLSHCRIV